MAWLVRDGDVLATAEVAETRRTQPAQGLLGRSDFEGALVLRPCRHVHTLFMRFQIDVAFCDGDGVVVRTTCLRPWRVSRSSRTPRSRSRLSPARSSAGASRPATRWK